MNKKIDEYIENYIDQEFNLMAYGFHTDEFKEYIKNDIYDRNKINGIINDFNLGKQQTHNHKNVGDIKVKIDINIEYLNETIKTSKNKIDCINVVVNNMNKLLRDNNIFIDTYRQSDMSIKYIIKNKYITISKLSYENVSKILYNLEKVININVVFVVIQD